MPGMRLLCSALAIGVAGVASATTAATAAPPDFGRCVKVTTGTGTYATGNCTTEGGEKKYEWIAGPGPKPGFALSLKPETTLFFEAVKSKVRLTCLGEAGSGEVTGTTTVGNVSLALTNCESGSLPCKSTGAGEGEVQVTGGTGTLGVVKAGETPLKDAIGLDLALDATATCGGGVVNLHVFGTAIGTISAPHSMAVKRAWKFTESKGFQKPTMFEGGPAESFEWVDNGLGEPVGLSLANLLVSEEKLEINTVF